MQPRDVAVEPNGDIVVAEPIGHGPLPLVGEGSQDEVLVGVDRVLFGSDFPHPEAIGEPRDYAKYISSIDAADMKKIMRDNTNALLAA